MPFPRTGLHRPEPSCIHEALAASLNYHSWICYARIANNGRDLLTASTAESVSPPNLITGDKPDNHTLHYLSSRLSSYLRHFIGLSWPSSYIPCHLRYLHSCQPRLRIILYQPRSYWYCEGPEPLAHPLVWRLRMGLWRM